MSGCKLEDNLFDIQVNLAIVFLDPSSYLWILTLTQLVMATPNTFIEWYESFSGIDLDAQLLGLLNRVLYTELDCYFSGGQMFHIFFHLQDRRILTINVSDFSIELSYDPWESIASYYESDHGFGFEYDRPNYDSRVLYNYASEEEFENLLQGYLV